MKVQSTIDATHAAQLVTDLRDVARRAEPALEPHELRAIDDADDANDLVREVARHLFAKEKKLKKPFLMLVEEVHEYIPEGGGLDDTGKMLVKIGKRGRKHGLGIVGISQRPADVKKDFITQCDWMAWHRLTWDNDTAVVRRVIDADHADAVQDLADGEAFLQADFRETGVERVQVRRKRTFDAGATPDLGEFERPDLKSVSGDLVSELEEISEQEQRRQDRIADLERQLETREETIDELQDELEQARDMTDMAEQFSEAMMQSASEGGDSGEALQAKIDEIREEKNARIAELEQENEALRDDLRERREDKADLEQRVAELEEYEQAVAHMDELREAVGRMNDALGMETGEPDDRLRERVESLQERVDETETENERLREELEDQQQAAELDTDVLENTKVKRFLQEMDRRISNLGDKERKMLRYYIIEGPTGMKDAYKYAGGSPTSGAKSDKTRTLREAGLVTKAGRGEYDYGLRDHVEGALGDSFAEDELDAVFNEVDDMVSEAVMGAET